MMNTYPENDYRGYLMHWGKGEEAKNHKYISRKKGKNGKWIYKYTNKEDDIEFLSSKHQRSENGEGETDLDHIWVDGKKVEIEKIKENSPLENTKLAKSMDTAKQNISNGARRLKKALTKPISEAKRQSKLNKSRNEINERVFKKYDNYMLNKNTPTGGFKFVTKDGKNTTTYTNTDSYKDNRESVLKQHGRRKTKKKLKNAWTPTNKRESN